MPQPAQQIRFCTSRDGTRIAYATCGVGPPLVWAAGWGHHLKLDWDCRVWRPWLDVLARRHTLVRYDWRGCGLSDREHVEFSFEKFVEDFEAVIEAAGLAPFSLFGMTAGAAISLTYAVRRPERVSRLVLYGSFVRNRLAGGSTPQEVAEAEARLKMLEVGWPDDSPAYGQFHTSLLMPDASIEQSQSFADLLRQTTSPATTLAIIRSVLRIDLREVVPKVRCPTLVLHSRGESLIRFEHGREVAGLIPGARFVPLEGRNTVLMETEPAWWSFVEALEDFLLAPTSKRARGSQPPFDGLTPRECEVLELVAQGLDNDSIGARLGISERTARNHVSIILSKLGINSRSQAIVRAREAGFGLSTSA